MSFKCTAGMWKLDDSQWKIDTNNPKLVEGSIGMYHWEIWCLDMVETVTTTKMSVKPLQVNRVYLSYTLLVCEN